MEDKDRRPPNSERTADPEDQPTLDSIPSSVQAGLAARYEILNEIGRGGMGIVYKARDRETGAVVVLKVLRPDIASRPDLMEGFKAELLLARKVTHKNVCRVYDLNRFGEVAAISMEYVEGESLRAFLQRFGDAPLGRGQEWARQICSGLAEAHSQGVLHRDIKPENILLDRQGNIKVMDFGIARSLETAATQTVALTGTPAYMSPEQAAGKPADARSDIYSLGLVLYEMFTGAPAFRADTPVALAHKQIHDTPTPVLEVNPHLPGFLDRAIQKCLEKNPAKRFQSVAELEAALTERVEAPPVPAGEDVPMPIHLTHWQRSDWLLVAAAVAGLLLFFPFFERTSLAPRSQVSFDRSVLRRIAQEYTQRLGVSPSGVSRINVWGNEHLYEYLAKTAGAPTALELMGKTVPCWRWEVHWTEEAYYSGGEKGTVLEVDNHGALQRFLGDISSNAADERLSIEEARPLAEKAVRDFFGRDPSLLLRGSAEFDASSGPATTLFTWADPKDNHGLKQHYRVRLVGRTIRFLHSYYEARAEYDVGYYFRQISPFMVIIVSMIIIGFMQRRKVEWTAPWRLVFVGALVAFWVWVEWRRLLDEPAFRLIGLLAGFGVVMTFFGFCASVAIECAIRKVGPAKLSSLTKRLIGKNASPSFGFAVLRGSFIGLAILGLDSLLVSAGTTHLPMWLDSFNQIVQTRTQFLSRAWTTGGVVVWAFWQGTAIGYTIVFLASVIAQFVRRRWVPTVAAATVAAVLLPGPLINLGAVQPYHWKIVFLFLECLLLALCYARFDLLTVFWAAFTFAFFWENYRLLVMFEPTGAVEQWIAFAVWGLFVLAAGATAFQTPLRAAYRRVAAGFE